MNPDRPIKRVYPWGHERRFNAFSNYFRKIHGARFQKVSIDAGFTCPNRDGTKGTGGCTFCNNKAFKPSYCLPGKSVSLQIAEGISFHERRYRKTSSYLAYFQAFSNTYSPIENLKKIFGEATRYPGIAGLVIGTRPDCVDDDILAYLKELSSECYVAVEYGVESCYNETLRAINRGHTFEEAENAIRKTSALGINTCAHFILGLPGESRDMILAGAGIISGLPLKTVKLHQLQLIRGTAMEEQYRKDPSGFSLFSWDEYLDLLVSFLERLNPELVIERLTGEAPPRFLAEKRWSLKRSDKLVSLVEKRLGELDTWQGRLHEGNIVSVKPDPEKKINIDN
jgi:hypothetical protein